MTKDQALKMALGSMSGRYCNLHKEAIAAIEEVLAQPEQEPVAWRWRERINSDFDSWVISASEPPPYSIEQQPLYTTPPQRKPLTEPELHAINPTWPAPGQEWGYEEVLAFARAIEAAHGIKE